MEALTSALVMLADPMVIGMLALSVVLGTIIGIVPGLGPSIAVALAIPFTLNMDLAPSVALLMGLYCASIYGGAITAILLNVPGTPASAATALDGHAIAMRGEGDLAVGVATVASVGGGLLSIVVLAVAAPFLARFALRFGPLEMCLVGAFALACIVVIERRILVRAVAAALVGLTLSAVGQDPLTGESRLTFGLFQLTAGIPLVPLLIGLFAISEVILRAPHLHPGGTATGLRRLGFRLPGAAWWRRGGPLVFKSSMIGTAMGVLPGAGPTAASFVSYAEAKRSSGDPDSFGKGNIDGVAASEAANNAVTGGALVPSLSLGIPGDPITAIILAALVLQGVIPGPRLYLEHYDLVLLILIVLFLANIALLVVGGLGAHLWTRVLRIPEPLLMAGVVVVATIGTFAANNSVFELKIMVAAAFLGVALRSLAFPVAPLIIGFVLGPMIEVNARQALIVYGGESGVLLERPIAAVLVVMIVLVLAFPLLIGAVRRVAGQLREDRS